MKKIISVLILSLVNAFPYVIEDVLLTNRLALDAFKLNLQKRLTSFNDFPENDGLFFGGEMYGDFKTGSAGFNIFLGANKLFSEPSKSNLFLNLNGYYSGISKTFSPDFTISNNNLNGYQYSYSQLLYLGSEIGLLKNLLNIQNNLFYQKNSIDDPNSLYTYLERSGSSYSSNTRYGFSKRLYEKEDVSLYSLVSFGGSLKLNLSGLFGLSPGVSALGYGDLGLSYRLKTDEYIFAKYKTLGGSGGLNVVSVGIENIDFFRFKTEEVSRYGRLFGFDINLDYCIDESRFRKIKFESQLYFVRFGLYYFSSALLEKYTTVRETLGFSLFFSTRARNTPLGKKIIAEFGVTFNDPDTLEYDPKNRDYLNAFYRMLVLVDIRPSY